MLKRLNQQVINLYFNHFNEIGLVSRIFTPETLVDESIKVASTISEYSKLAVGIAKEAVNYCKIPNSFL